MPLSQIRGARYPGFVEDFSNKDLAVFSFRANIDSKTRVDNLWTKLKSLPILGLASIQPGEKELVTEVGVGKHAHVWDKSQEGDDRFVFDSKNDTSSGKRQLGTFLTQLVKNPFLNVFPAITEANYFWGPTREFTIGKITGNIAPITFLSDTVSAAPGDSGGAVTSKAGKIYGVASFRRVSTPDKLFYTSGYSKLDNGWIQDRLESPFIDMVANGRATVLLSAGQELKVYGWNLEGATFTFANSTKTALAKKACTMKALPNEAPNVCVQIPVMTTGSTFQLSVEKTGTSKNVLKYSYPDQIMQVN